MIAGFDIQPLGPGHDRAAFSCGEESLDDYLKTRARKESALNLNATFVLSPTEATSVVAGYYTLSAHTLEVTGIPEQARRRFPRYPLAPVTLLGRLATSLDYRGRMLGEALLLDALARAQQAAESVGSFAVVVDPLHDKASAFYQKYGFLPLDGDTARQYLPMATIRKLDLETAVAPDETDLLAP